MKNLSKSITLLLLFTLLYVSMCEDKAKDQIIDAIKKLTAQPLSDKKLLSGKFSQHDHLDYDSALKLRENLEEKYHSVEKEKSKRQRVRIPKRFHSDIKNKDSSIKGRLLDSVSNQFPTIDEGNTNQAHENNFVYTLKGNQVFVHSVNGSQLTRVIYQNYTTQYPRQIHVSNGYFAVIVQKYLPNPIVVVKVFHNTGTNATLIREYHKLGQYVESRQQNSNLLVVTQKQLPSSDPEDIDNKWNISGIGVVSQTIFEGIGANTTSNAGPAARSIARIPLGPSSNTNYRLAIYLMVDYTWDIILTPNLNIYIAGNFYNTNGTVSIQKLSLGDKAGVVWGTSSWVILRGLIFNNYQMHQYSGSFRTTLAYSGSSGGIQDEVSVVRIPITNFTLSAATVYTNVAISQNGITSARWRNDIVYLMIYPNIIHTFSSSFGSITNTITPNMMTYYLYPYGSNHMIVFGATLPSANDVAVGLIAINNYGLTFKKSVVLSANATNGGSSFTYSIYGWYSVPYFQADFDTKRVTFPLFTSENEPYKSGYFQLYVDTTSNCISGLPVSSNCATQSSVIPVHGKLFKHFDNSTTYIYNSGASEEILRSSTLTSGAQKILITMSPCQLQARTLKSPTQAPNIMPYSTNTQVSAVDLC